MMNKFLMTIVYNNINSLIYYKINGEISLNKIMILFSNTVVFLIRYFKFYNDFENDELVVNTVMWVMFNGK